MRSIIVLAAAMVSLAGCASIEDVRARPPAWKDTLRGDYETMTNCIAANFTSGGLSVLPQFNARDQRSNVILYNTRADSAAAEFELRQTSPTEVEVTFRQRNTVFGQEGAARSTRDLADRCARAS